MQNDVVKTAYSKEASESYDTKRFSCIGGAKIHEIETSVLRTALGCLLRGSKVLEVGCGTGRLMTELSQLGFAVDGIDASPYMITECKKKADRSFPTSELVVSEAVDLPHQSNKYDLVYCIRFLNQTESKQYALDCVAEMSRVAKPGGYILVEFMNSYRIRRSGAKDVQFRPEEITDWLSQWGSIVWCRGAFFFGINRLRPLPSVLVYIGSAVDQALSRLFPSLCDRIYILCQKG